jgi:hypothetical protein
MTGFQVMRKRCDQCLFSSNKIVSDDRKQEILDGCLQQGDEKFFICHKSSIAGGAVCCRGFYDSLGEKVAIIQIAKRLQMVEFIDQTGEE